MDAGWTTVRSKYDDGGFSGGNTDRPALQRLLEDVRGSPLQSAMQKGKLRQITVLTAGSQREPQSRRSR